MSEIGFPSRGNCFSCPRFHGIQRRLEEASGQFETDTREFLFVGVELKDKRGK